MIKDSNLAYLITRTTCLSDPRFRYSMLLRVASVTPQSRIGHEVVFRQVLLIPAVASLSIPPLPLTFSHHSVDQLMIS
jgi:hypothetical protein